MKDLKKYFKMIVTAVVCFFMGMISGKRENEKVVKVLTNGQAACKETRGMSGCSDTAGTSHEFFTMQNANYAKYDLNRKYNLYLKRIFFWLGGPGDKPRPVLSWTPL